MNDTYPNSEIGNKPLKTVKYLCDRKQQRIYYFNLMRDICTSRLKLLHAASQGGPGTIPVLEKASPASTQPSPVHQRVRRRYFQELAAVREEVQESSPSSEDENYPGRLC